MVPTGSSRRGGDVAAACSRNESAVLDGSEPLVSSSTAFIVAEASWGVADVRALRIDVDHADHVRLHVDCEREDARSAVGTFDGRRRPRLDPDAPADPEQMGFVDGERLEAGA